MARKARADARRIKTHRSYTVAEAADVLGVHPNTVGNWLKKGLPSIMPRGERLILGADLKDHLERCKRDRRQTSPPGAMYCLKCRSPRTPPAGLWEVASESETTLNLRGLCPDCSALMHRKVARGRLSEAGFGESATLGQGAALAAASPRPAATAGSARAAAIPSCRTPMGCRT